MEFTKPELDLFQSPRYQSQIEKWVTREFTPIASISRGAPIEFIISPIEGHMPDLSRSALYVRAKITTATGAALANDAHVSCANMPLHSMWSAVEVRLGNTLISDANAMYPYRAILETLLSYSQDTLDTQKQSALFIRDTAGKLNATKTSTGEATNLGLNARGAYFAKSVEVELMDRLHVDIFNPEIYLPPGLTIRIRLIPAADSFVIIADGGTANQLSVVEAKMFVPFKVPSEAQLAALELALAKKPVRIAYRRVALKHLTIPSTVTSSTTDNIIMGKLPKRIVLALVAEATMGGTFATNPFEFDDFEVNYLALYVNGELVPSKPYQPNFPGKQYIREYLGMLDAMDVTNRPRGITIKREEFGQTGYTLFAFDLSADQAPNSNSYDARRTGSVRLDIRFAKALTAAVNVVIFAEYLAELMIDKYRNAITDY